MARKAGSTGKLARFLVEPGHLEKRSGHVKGVYLTNVLKVPKKSGGGFFQNGGITESILDLTVPFRKCH